MDRSNLLKILTASFSQSELQTLCFDLSIDYDELRGEGKNDKARDLILYCERRNRLNELIRLVEKTRPHIAYNTAAPYASSQASNPSLSQLDHQNKRQLRNKLLACPSISDPASRATIIQQMPLPLRSAIGYDARADIHVQNMIDTCLNYRDGLEILIAQVRSFDEGTFQMSDLDQWIESIRV